jgi:hypothetical protein
MSVLGDVFDELSIALRAVLVALAGVMIAFFWFNGDWAFSVAFVGGGLVIGVIAQSLGERQLPDHPERALEVMEFSVIAPATVAAAAAALVIIVSVSLTVTGDEDIKALAAAMATGITAFLTTTLIEWTGDKEDSKVANRIRQTFWAHYNRTGYPVPPGERVKLFAPDSDGERWVYSAEFKGIDGWGREARRTRARGIAQCLTPTVAP